MIPRKLQIPFAMLMMALCILGMIIALRSLTAPIVEDFNASREENKNAKEEYLLYMLEHECSKELSEEEYEVLKKNNKLADFCKKRGEK